MICSLKQIQIFKVLHKIIQKIFHFPSSSLVLQLLTPGFHVHAENSERIKSSKRALASFNIEKYTLKIPHGSMYYFLHEDCFHGK